MKYNPDIHHRRSIRLKGYDYSQNGLYFITICTHDRRYLFGNISDGMMALNPMGEIAHKEWQKTAEMRPNVRLHESIIMPNHIHVILEIIPAPQSPIAHTPPPPVRARCTRPIPPIDPMTVSPIDPITASPIGPMTASIGPMNTSPIGPMTASVCGGVSPGRVQRAPAVGDIVRGYKSSVTKHINQLRNMPGTPVWQRNYYERIIRDETAYRTITRYIRNNPQKWQADKFHS